MIHCTSFTFEFSFGWVGGERRGGGVTEGREMIESAEETKRISGGTIRGTNHLHTSGHQHRPKKKAQCGGCGKIKAGEPPVALKR